MTTQTQERATTTLQWSQAKQTWLKPGRVKSGPRIIQFKVVDVHEIVPWSEIKKL